jgi:hypothetical protein
VSLPKRISDIDWTNWSPVDPATLIFIVQDEQILLIRKKQGLGAGKINDIPYEEMWEDDRIWLPLLLARKQFSGYWLFNGDRMLDYFLDVVTEEK